MGVSVTKYHCPLYSSGPLLSPSFLFFVLEIFIFVFVLFLLFAVLFYRNRLSFGDHVLRKLVYFFNLVTSFTNLVSPLLTMNDDAIYVEPM